MSALVGSVPVVECMTRDTRVAGSVPDLGQGCLQRLSVRRNTSRERVNTIFDKKFRLIRLFHNSR